MTPGQRSEALRARVADLVQQVKLGSGEQDLAQGLMNVLDLCDYREATGNRTLTTRQIRDAIHQGLA